MNKIQNFFGKSLKKTIGGVELEFTPLTTADLDIVLDLSSTDANMKKQAIERMINTYLDKLFPDSTPEERGKISLGFLNDFTQAIFEVNGLNTNAPVPTNPV